MSVKILIGGGYIIFHFGRDYFLFFSAFLFPGHYSAANSFRPLFSLALVFLAGTFLLGQKWSAGKINAAAKIIGRQKVKDADRKEKEKINSRP